MKLLFTSSIFLLACLKLQNVVAQKGQSSLSDTELFTQLAGQDNALFHSFNTCDLTNNGKFFADNIQFYHDKGGVYTKSDLAKASEGRCQNKVKTRRELVNGSLKVYPLEGIGGIQIGEHNFYQKEEGQPERHGSNAKFVHLWEQKDGNWRISRVLSFDHQDPTHHEPVSKELYNRVSELDNQFFRTYNECNLDSLKEFLVEDVEFYHDKSGLTLSRGKVVESIRKFICGSEEGKIRRELVPGTLEVFPMKNYGAIEMGEHYFYITGKDGVEKRTGIAKFIMLWHNEEGNWQMSMIFSFDHQPAVAQN